MSHNISNTNFIAGSKENENAFNGFSNLFLRTINFHLSLRNYHALIIFRSNFKDILKLKQQTLINKLVPV